MKLFGNSCFLGALLCVTSFGSTSLNRRQLPLMVRPLPPVEKTSAATRYPTTASSQSTSSGTSTSQTNQMSGYFPSPRRGTPIDLTVGPGVAIYGGRYSTLTQSGLMGFAVNAGFGMPIFEGSQLFVGADLGLNFWSFDSQSKITGVSAMGIQLLPTAYYKFRLDLQPPLHPYFGVSVGPNIYTGKTTNLTSNESTSETFVFLEVLFRPGLGIELAKEIAFDIEPKFGILRSEFIFLPQISAHLFL